ncbi:MAG: DinB family protein [Phycisphaeraceae bacterium]|nr:DinB family protein [Phycisphaeraceae bacterium]
MGALADSIVESAKIGRRYADRLLKDVRPEQFARRPIVGGREVETNHAAFVYGHLAVTNAWMATLMRVDEAGLSVVSGGSGVSGVSGVSGGGGGGAVVSVPAGYEALFKDGVECRDDPEGSIYPPMKEITDVFFTTFDRLIGMVASAPDESLAVPTPDSKARAFVSTVGTAGVFMLNSHIMMHMGQVSVWRRCMGLGRA